MLAVLIALVWRPCVGVPLPLEHFLSPECAAVTSGGNTSWVGLLLWPVALAAAGLAAVRVIARGWGVIGVVLVLLLDALALLANPLPEYWLLNLSAQSWDEPPYTGALTAATLGVAGLLLLLSTRAPTARRTRGRGPTSAAPRRLAGS